MLLMSKASQDSAGNCYRLTNEEGEKGRSQAHPSAQKEAKCENQGLDTKTHSAYPHSGTTVDSSHPPIARPGAQAGADVESRGYPNHNDSDQNESQTWQKLTLPGKEIDADLEGGWNN